MAGSEEGQKLREPRERSYRKLFTSGPGLTQATNYPYKTNTDSRRAEAIRAGALQFKSYIRHIPSFISELKPDLRCF